MRVCLLVICSLICSLTFGQSIKVYDQFEAFQADVLTQPKGDTIHIVNFWATWCKPCVEELPYFEAFHQQSNTQQPVKITLVSLDFKNQLERRVEPFVQKHSLKSEVVLLADGNSNRWIDLVDPKWSGAIPATVILTSINRSFYEKSYHNQQEIISDIQSTLKQ